MNDIIMHLCQALEQEFDDITIERKLKLIELSDYIISRKNEDEIARLVVICTHNSRRSHMGQIWAQVAADYYGIRKIETFSGGTEATAFNPRAVSAFKKVGFDVNIIKNDDDNHRYELRWSEDMEAYQAFSKRYDDTPNPSEKFAAIMVCTSADEGCPIITGCDFRLSLPYEDPKAYDDTGLEAEMYDERLRQIGRDMLFCFSQI